MQNKNKTNKKNKEEADSQRKRKDEWESRSLPNEVGAARLTVEVGQLCVACALRTDGH
jgi:hypothetical protein